MILLKIILIRFSILVLGIVLICGCSYNRPYSAWLGYGYKDYQLGSRYPDSFLVTYEAQGLANLGKVDKGLKTRGKEVCSEKTKYNDQMVFYRGTENADFSFGTYTTTFYNFSDDTFTSTSFSQPWLWAPGKRAYAVVFCTYKDRGILDIDILQLDKDTLMLIKTPPGVEIRRSGILGIEEGDVLSKIDKHRTINIGDFIIATRDKKPGDTSKLTLWREDEKVIIEVTYK